MKLQCVATDMFEHFSGWNVTWNVSSRKVSRELHDRLRERRATSKSCPLTVAKQLCKSKHAHVCVVTKCAVKKQTCAYIVKVGIYLNYRKLFN